MFGNWIMVIWDHGTWLLTFTLNNKLMSGLKY
jgi:hypothetical protein